MLARWISRHQLLRFAQRCFGFAQQVGEHFSGRLDLVYQARALSSRHEGAIRIDVGAAASGVVHDPVARRGLRLQREWLDLRRVLFPLECVLGADDAAGLAGVRARPQGGIFVRPDDCLAIALRRLRLRRCDKAGADHDALRTDRERRRYLAPVRDSSGSQHRQSHCVDHLRHQREHSDFAGMPARLGALRDDHVSAGVLRLDPVMDLAAHHDDFHPVVMHHLDEFLWHRKSGDEDLDLFFDHHGHMGAHHVGNRREQIDGERLVGQLASLADFGAQIVGAQRRGADHAKSAGVGDCGDQLVHRDAAHSGEQNRVLDSKVIANRRMQHESSPVVSRLCDWLLMTV